MKSHDDIPVARPVPFPRNHPWRSLDDWLSPDLALLYPQTSTRLRDLADAQGMMAAAWSSAIGSGLVLILGGVFALVLSGSPVLVVILGLAGLALTLLGTSSWKRVRNTLPNTKKVLTTRGPTTGRGGIIMVSLLAVAIGVPIFLEAPEIASQGKLVTMIGSYLLLVSFLVACLLVPSTVIGRSRTSFRKRLQSNPALRAAVDNDRATWSDPYGHADFGPL